MKELIQYKDSRILILLNDINYDLFKIFNIAYIKHLNKQLKYIHIIFNKNELSYLKKYDRIYYQNNYNLYINCFNDIDHDVYEFTSILNTYNLNHVKTRLIHDIDLAIGLKDIINNKFIFKTIKNRYSNLNDITIDMSQYLRKYKLQNINI